ncbi:hypothetical protein QBC37DRAFT_373112 [Rhypophila decipiens]|uniref:Uncharacterized protein n=1 Tax=Rhypophila decipiens TaxID=261697 RepID=A0AAN7B8J6_9PEZI|nr:hypothetical protein QBC37DRAFT_373112 [Rhypophila decipiens]
MPNQKNNGRRRGRRRPAENTRPTKDQAPAQLSTPSTGRRFTSLPTKRRSYVRRAANWYPSPSSPSSFSYSSRTSTSHSHAVPVMVYQCIRGVWEEWLAVPRVVYQCRGCGVGTVATSLVGYPESMTDPSLGAATSIATAVVVALAREVLAGTRAAALVTPVFPRPGRCTPQDSPCRPFFRPRRAALNACGAFTDQISLLLTFSTDLAIILDIYPAFR